jgi:hypothetical protein
MIPSMITCARIYSRQAHRMIPDRVIASIRDHVIASSMCDPGWHHRGIAARARRDPM